VHVRPLGKCTCAQPPCRAAASSIAELCTSGTDSDRETETLEAGELVSTYGPAISSRGREGMGPKLRLC
jgi:hypothetical protein